jgi:Protein of unknown function (DUF2505)
VRFELVQLLHAPLEAVEAAFVDPAFLIKLASLPKLGNPELVEQEDRGDELWQRVRYAFAGELSPTVKAVVDPDRLTWIEESTLDRVTHTTTFRILPDHYARMLEASGTITLTANGTGADAVTDRRGVGEVVVHVPLVGRKVEAAIISGLREHAELEVSLVERWATDHQ